MQANTHESGIINKCVGIPWLKGGRDITTGVDCWGFVEWYYLNYLGVILDYEYNYMPGDTYNITKAFEKEKKSLFWKQIVTPKTNCVVALSSSSKIHHVGVWVGSGCLHAVYNQGVVYNDKRQLKRNGFNKIEYYAISSDKNT